MKALNELRQEKTHVILMDDKEMILLVLDKEDYIEKADSLLEQGTSYRTITTDPAKSQMNKLIKLFKIKTEGGINETT